MATFNQSDEDKPSKLLKPARPPPPKSSAFPKSSTTSFANVKFSDLSTKEDEMEEKAKSSTSHQTLEKSHSMDVSHCESDVEGCETAIQMGEPRDLDEKLRAGKEKFKSMIHKGREELKERFAKHRDSTHEHEQLVVHSNVEREVCMRSLSDETPPINFANATSGIEIASQVVTHPTQSFTTESNSPSQSPIAPPESTISPAILNYKLIIISTLVCLLACTHFLPSFLAGILWGVAMSSGVTAGVYFVLAPRKKRDSFEMQGSFANQGVANIEDMIKNAESNILSDVVYRGWMTTLADGEPYKANEFSVSATISMLVRLDGPTLRLSKPVHSVLRHGCWMDPTLRDKTHSYAAQTMFDITNAKVCLRPRRLASRRWWSRKYPICIRLKTGTGNNQCDDDSFRSQSVRINKNCADSPDEDSGESDQTVSSSGTSHKISKKKVKILYLWARCSREKEMWFHRLRQSASMYSFRAEQKNVPSPSRSISVAGNASLYSPNSYSSLPPVKVACKPDGDSLSMYSEGSMSTVDSDSVFESNLQEDDGWARVEDANSIKNALSTIWMQYSTTQTTFSSFMQRLASAMPKTEVQSVDSTCVNVGSTKVYMMDLGLCKFNEDRLKRPIADAFSTSWANAMAARIFFDCTADPKWIDVVKSRIQGKLATLRLPHYIEQLHLSKLEPGSDPPRITAAYEHVVNEWGLWMDFKVEYGGGFTLALETKVNLMKLKHGSGPNNMQFDSDEDCGTHRMSVLRPGRYSDEEAPESPESSPDEDSGFMAHIPLLKQDVSQPKESKGKKILNFVDKISNSKVFQDVTDTKFMQKVMKGISDTPLMLKVEVVVMKGIVTINIPPPPSDRLWYAFRTPPNVELKVSPKVGEKVIGVTQVTEWIGNKLKQLMEKNLVLPNMDDIKVPLMSGSPLLHNLNQ